MGNDELIKQLRKMVTEEVGKIKESVETTINKAKEEIKAENKNEMNELKKQIEKYAGLYEKTREEVKDLKEGNVWLHQRLDDLEQYSRISNVIVRGIKEKKDETEEDLLESVKELGKSLGVQLEESDISTLHRLPTRKGIQPVIVRLNNRMKKKRLVKNSKECNLEDGIKVYNHLTKRSMELLNAARDLRANGVVQFVWENDGKIFVRKDERSPAKRILDVEQLYEFGPAVNGGSITRSKSALKQGDFSGGNPMTTRNSNRSIRGKI